MKLRGSLTTLLGLALAAMLDAADPAPEAPKVNYVFNAKIVRVIDAATVALDVDLGFHVWLHNQAFVLQNVAAPAPDADKVIALAAKTRTQKVLAAEEEVVLQSIRDKTDKSGSYHAVLWKDGQNLNEKIIRDGNP
jgi:hypothetical protein